jgi:hypothetical protein
MNALSLRDKILVKTKCQKDPRAVGTQTNELVFYLCIRGKRNYELRKNSQFI